MTLHGLGFTLRAAVERSAPPMREIGARLGAWVSLYELMQREAPSSFIDNFWRLAWIFAAVIPFVLFLGGGAPRPRRRRTSTGRRRSEA